MKKVLFSLLTLFFFLSFSFRPAFAASSWSIMPKNIIDAGDKPALENLVKANFMGALSLGIIASTGGGSGSTNGGVSGAMTNMVFAMSQKPGGASTAEYIADMGHDLGIVPKEAYAQGSTFAGLSPILELWKKMRDLTYLVYVLVFMVIGFMILLRKKIDPRTVITIEAALPKLIISLLLITFSYAIIAFMVDGANLISRIGANFFVGGSNDLFSGKTSGYALSKIFSTDIFRLVRPIGDSSVIATQIGKMFDNNTGLSALDDIVSAATWAVFSFATMFITFKIFFSLLGPYVGIVLSIIFAPIQLLMMAIPGSEASIGNWLKSVLSKIAVFPVVFFMILIAATFGARTPYGFSCGTLGCLDWEKNTVFQDNLKNLNLILLPFGNWSAIIGQLISFGILFTIPSAIQLVQNALKVKDAGGDIATQTIRKGMSKVPGLKGLAE